MGQKVHPYGFRIGFNKTWKSRWFANKDYANLLHEDLALKKDLKKKYEALRSNAPYSPDAVSAGRRALKNLCLGYLSEIGLTPMPAGQRSQVQQAAQSMPNNLKSGR